ncbi:hypothetical protein Tco_0823943 [Tanacetum coccineum]|uniref:Uncharacterized protein n=1 Tax=Tanacetum coccineum TaxID=301880 RepID=A0ABQ5AP02_9ASTR
MEKCSEGEPTNKLTHPHPKRNFVPTAVATKSGQVPVNAAKQSSPRAASLISTVRPVNTTTPKPKVNDTLHTTYSYFKAHSPGNPQYTLQDQGIFNSGCSRHMTGNKSFLTYYQEIDGGFVAFGESLKGDGISDEFGVKTGSCKVNAARQDLVLLGKKGNADFHQIVDFLNASTIRYSLTISPTIYASYIEQFWATAKSKIVNNETQIHAKVDGKTIVISESSVRSNLHFNDEDGVTSLTNSEILENLALMGYEIVSDKLTFQKAFFSPQWKYLIHTILHCLSLKSTAWNEFSTNIASAVICLANNQKFNFSKLIFDGMLRNLDPNSKKFLMYPRFLQLFLNNQVKNLAEAFNDTYETPKHTQKVFASMRRKGKSFSGTVTPLFASMLVPQEVEGEGSGQPSEPQPLPSTAPPSQEEQVLAVATSHPQKTQTPRQAKRGRDTKIPQSGGLPKKVGDEDVYTGEDDRVVRATTTATSLEAEQESGNIHKTQSTATLNEPSPQGTGSGSRPRCQDTILGDADAQTSMEHQDDLTDFVPPTPHDSPLLGGHILGSDEDCSRFGDQKLKKKLKRLEKKLRARTPGMKLFKIGTSRRKSLDKENVSKQGRNLKTRPMFEEGDFDDDFDDIDDMVNEAMENVEGDRVNVGGVINTATTGVTFEDEDITIAQTLVKMRSQKDKEKGNRVAFRAAQEESARPIRILSTARPTRILPTIDLKYKGKGIMQKP